MIRFHNTLSGEVEPFVPMVPGRVGLYTCGPTVYGYPHIGNYRAYVFEDILKRFLLFSGLEVTHVMNITDVDDKTILGAQRRKQTLREYTEAFTLAFFEDSATLRIMPAYAYPRATEHIPEMTALIRGLLDKGYAYYQGRLRLFQHRQVPGLRKALQDPPGRPRARTPERRRRVRERECP